MAGTVVGLLSGKERVAVVPRVCVQCTPNLPTYCSNSAGSLHEQATKWISLVTAGGFIYVACVTVMPTLLEPCSVGTHKPCVCCALWPGRVVEWRSTDCVLVAHWCRRSRARKSCSHSLWAWA